MRRRILINVLSGIVLGLFLFFGNNSVSGDKSMTEPRGRNVALDEIRGTERAEKSRITGLDFNDERVIIGFSNPRREDERKQDERRQQEERRREDEQRRRTGDYERAADVDMDDRLRSRDISQFSKPRRDDRRQDERRDERQQDERRREEGERRQTGNDELERNEPDVSIRSNRGISQLSDPRRDDRRQDERRDERRQDERRREGDERRQAGDDEIIVRSESDVTSRSNRGISQFSDPRRDDRRQDERRDERRQDERRKEGDERRQAGETIDEITLEGYVDTQRLGDEGITGLADNNRRREGGEQRRSQEKRRAENERRGGEDQRREHDLKVLNAAEEPRRSADRRREDENRRSDSEERRNNREMASEIETAGIVNELPRPVRRKVSSPENRRVTSQRKRSSTTNRRRVAADSAADYVASNTFTRSFERSDGREDLFNNELPRRKSPERRNEERKNEREGGGSVRDRRRVNRLEMEEFMESQPQLYQEPQDDGARDKRRSDAERRGASRRRMSRNEPHVDDISFLRLEISDDSDNRRKNEERRNEEDNRRSAEERRRNEEDRRRDAALSSFSTIREDLTTIKADSNADNIEVTRDSNGSFLKFFVTIMVNVLALSYVLPVFNNHTMKQNEFNMYPKALFDNLIMKYNDDDDVMADNDKNENPEDLKPKEIEA